MRIKKIYDLNCAPLRQKEKIEMQKNQDNVTKSFPYFIGEVGQKSIVFHSIFHFSVRNH